MTLQYTTLDIERSGALATLWMNRPQVFNAFNATLIDELAQALQALDADASVRVVVLAGRGRHFSAGADLNWMQQASGQSEAESLPFPVVVKPPRDGSSMGVSRVMTADEWPAALADARRFAHMLRTLSALSKPSIARVHSAALGGGTGLAAACDMAIASDDAVFSTSEVRFGIVPAVISPYVLRAIGARNALRYFQSAERFGAQRALEMGLVSEVVAAEQLDARVLALAQALMAGAPQAQQAAKALIAAVDGRGITDAVCEETAQRIARQRATEEARAGFAAFLDKQDPPWLAH